MSPRKKAAPVADPDAFQLAPPEPVVIPEPAPPPRVATPSLAADCATREEPVPLSSACQKAEVKARMATDPALTFEAAAQAICLEKLLGATGLEKVQIQAVDAPGLPFRWAPEDDRTVVQVRTFAGLPLIDILGWVGRPERLAATREPDGTRVAPYAARRRAVELYRTAIERGWTTWRR